MRDDKSEYMILKNRAYIGADDGTYEWAVKEIDRLREALAVIYKAADKERDENDEYWWVDNQTTVQAYICSVLGAPPNAALGEGE